MKTHVLPFLLLQLAFTGVPSRAGEVSSGSVLPKDARMETQKEMTVYTNFRKRFETAIESRDLVVIQALYQTNGITAEDLKVEMARWPSLLSEEAKAGVAFYFKELSTLPPQAREFYSERARRLTKHEVTHLVMVRLPAGYQLTLPLVLVEGRLLIVPSDERKAEVSIKPVGPANGSQPIRSETNSTSSAAVPRR